MLRGGRGRLRAAGALLGVLFGLGLASGQARPSPLPVLPAPTAKDRVLVIAPHCDDETLACGGLIQQARAVHAPVEVVIVTNGDAFRSAAARAFHTRRVTPKQYLELGLRRQRESLTALARFGVSARQVTFLGYPDGGLVRMWTQYWELDQPYTSTATKQDHSPYPNSFRHKAPYAGRAVVDDLASLLRRFRPTIVALPHPGDRHPDHWSTYGFGTAALYETGAEAQVRPVYYLVHRPGWSEPPREEGGPLRAPPDRFDVWQALSLTPLQLSRQRAAFGCYRTQVQAVRDFMLQFLGKQEFFASIPWARLARFPAEPDPGENRLHVLELAPVAQSLPSAPTHFRTMRVGVEGGKLRVLLELNEPFGGATSYRLYAHSLARGRVEAPREYVLDPAHPSAGVTVRAEGRLLDALLPWESEAAGLMLAAEARTPGALPDRTRWVTLLAKE